MPDTKADLVARVLLDQIVGGELSPGTILPKVEDLALEHGVNRGVVREAIKLLEAYRLVHPVKKRGTEVLDPRASMAPAVVRSLLGTPASPDPQAVNEFMDVVEVLDVAIARGAATHRRARDVQEIKKILAGLTRVQEDPGHREAYLADWHLALARATGNRLYEMWRRWSWQSSLDVRRLLRRSAPPTRSLIRYVTAVSAGIEAREPDACQTAVESYFRRWHRGLVETLGPGGSSV